MSNTTEFTIDDIIEEEQRLARCAQSAEDVADELIKEARSLVRSPKQVSALHARADEKRAKAAQCRNEAIQLRKNWINTQRVDTADRSAT